MRISRKHSLLLLSLVLATACEGLGVTVSQAIGVSNQTDAPVLVLLLDAETAALVDPAPVLPFEPGDARVLQPGEDRTFPVADIVGDFDPLASDLVVFTYRAEEAEAKLAGYLERTHEQLLYHGFHVAIETLWPDDAKG